MSLVAGEGSVKESVNDLKRKTGADNSCAHCEDVRVVVQPCHLGREAVAAEGRADALDLVCRDGNADAGAADYDALFALAVCYRMGARLAVNGIVAAILGVSAVVFLFNASRVEVLHDLLLERPAAVVGT